MPHPASSPPEGPAPLRRDRAGEPLPVRPLRPGPPRGDGPCDRPGARSRGARACAGPVLADLLRRRGNVADAGRQAQEIHRWATGNDARTPPRPERRPGGAGSLRAGAATRRGAPGRRPPAAGARPAQPEDDRVVPPPLTSGICIRWSSTVGSGCPSAAGTEARSRSGPVSITGAAEGGPSPGRSTRASTTLRPPSSAVQPWAAGSCANRWSPSPPRAASRPTAGVPGWRPPAGAGASRAPRR
jgi:hypothetical protein